MYLVRIGSVLLLACALHGVEEKPLPLPDTSSAAQKNREADWLDLDADRLTEIAKELNSLSLLQMKIQQCIQGGAIQKSSSVAHVLAPEDDIVNKLSKRITELRDKARDERAEALALRLSARKRVPSLLGD